MKKIKYPILLNYLGPGDVTLDEHMELIKPILFSGREILRENGLVRLDTHYYNMKSELESLLARNDLEEMERLRKDLFDSSVPIIKERTKDFERIQRSLKGERQFFADIYSEIYKDDPDFKPELLNFSNGIDEKPDSKTDEVSIANFSLNPINTSS